MKEYQPWDDSWRNELTFVPWPPNAEYREELPPLPLYPVFNTAIEQKLEGEEMWQTIGGSIIFLLGHEPDHPFADLYIKWLRQFDPQLAHQLMTDGTTFASNFNFPNAIWMLQAALLLEPGQVEANFNLGLAFSQLGDTLRNDKYFDEAVSSYRQAYQYLKNAIELDPQLGMAHYALGVVCSRLGRPEESKACLEKSIELEIAKKAPKASDEASDRMQPHPAALPSQDIPQKM